MNVGRGYVIKVDRVYVITKVLIELLGQLKTTYIQSPNCWHNIYNTNVNTNWHTTPLPWAQRAQWHPTTYTFPPNCWHDIYNTNVKKNLHTTPQLLAWYIQYQLCRSWKTITERKTITESGQLWEPISPHFFAENTHNFVQCCVKLPKNIWKSPVLKKMKKKRVKKAKNLMLMFVKVKQGIKRIVL